ncbi:ABC transporter permease [candidate division TA06 bacterium]|uniref:Cell division protein FtsX n=1 Tax=candidate division TA06 bacterium TaxID=2250710 RepID=A0A933I9H3_UNCT6|nr:ABC transporter permease [candidate division TA06 bacterium]
MNISYYWREAISGMRRAKLLSLLSVSSITAALFLLGTFLLVTVNFLEAVKSLKGKFQIQAFISDGAEMRDINGAKRIIEGMEGISQVSYISKQEALAEFRQEMGAASDFLDVLENNPLPRSFKVSLNPECQNPQAIVRVSEEIAKLPGVEEVEYGKSWLVKLYRIGSLLLAIDFSLLVIVSAAVLIVVFNTIRLTFYARRPAIEIMRLVGATDGFIRRPFVLEGFLQGALGSLIGLLMLYAGWRLVASQFGMLRFFTLRESVLLLGFGILLGALGSWGAARIFLKRV